MIVGYILTLVVLLALSAFFSGTEIAYASASEVRLRRASEAADASGRGRKRAHWTLWIHTRDSEALTTILIGNNLVNTAASSVGTLLVLALLGNGYAWVATLGMTILTLVFGEITPKLIAKDNAEAFATAVSPILRGLMWVLRPLIWLVQAFVNGMTRLLRRGAEPEGPAVTEEVASALVDTAEDEGSIDEEAADLLQSALQFDALLAHEVITPRVDMIAIDIEDSLGDIIDAAIRAPYSRLPVCDGSKDNIIGILHVTRFLKRLLDDPTPDVRAMLLPACFVPGTAPLHSVFDTMRRQRVHLVIVCDEFGGTEGILTMEDILEELVGDIWDETDVIDDDLTPLPGGRFAANGDMRVKDLLDELDINAHNLDVESTTLGGWAAELLGHEPRPGESFHYGGLRLTVEAVHKRRVVRVMIAFETEAEALTLASGASPGPEETSKGA